jgi:hypothetical protein
MLVSSLQVFEYASVYDPVADCCVDKCPANSGIVVKSDTQPVSCVSCGSNVGLIFNSITGFCQCQTGFYSLADATAIGNDANCFPCYAKFCTTCTKEAPTICTACITGSALDNNDKTCKCIDGYFEYQGICKDCPIRCKNCLVQSVCSACSDSATRDFNNNCSCIVGYYDANVTVCQTCQILCKTCSFGNNCTTCFEDKNRTLVNGQCVCRAGFYQKINSDGSLTCEPCSPECTACTLSPIICSNCDTASNRILGYDNLNHQTCFCAPGFTERSDGNCV